MYQVSQNQYYLYNWAKQLTTYLDADLLKDVSYAIGYDYGCRLARYNRLPVLDYWRDKIHSLMGFALEEGIVQELQNYRPFIDDISYHQQEEVTYSVKRHWNLACSHELLL